MQSNHYPFTVIHSFFGSLWDRFIASFSYFIKFVIYLHFPQSKHFSIASKFYIFQILQNNMKILSFEYQYILAPIGTEQEALVGYYRHYAKYEHIDMNFHTVFQSISFRSRLLFIKNNYALTQFNSLTMQSAPASNTKDTSSIFQLICARMQNSMRIHKHLIILIRDNNVKPKDDPPRFINISPPMTLHLTQLLSISTNNEQDIIRLQIYNFSLNQQLCLGLTILEKIGHKYTNLRHLCLTRCNIGDNSLIFLQRCRLEFLNELNLGSNKLTKRGMKILALCEFQNISWLRLYQNRIGNAGVSNLMRANWNQSFTFDLEDCNTTWDVMRTIGKTSWPQVHLQGGSNEWLYGISLKQFTKQYYPFLNHQDNPFFISWGIVSAKIDDSYPDYDYSPIK